MNPGLLSEGISAFTKSVVEEGALTCLEALGYSIAHGPDIAPGELAAERKTYGQVLLEGRLRQALALCFRQASGSIRCSIAIVSNSRPVTWRLALPKVAISRP